ncbi:hypothetical protein [Corallococcus llansteffanensis]|uniref:Uncharacterized protein n=1 Tax=Corallococcus llansteffanensis TaxID=2316731 RepID=A0A3A8NQR0_9BACT|nr:hypothetical protein [Corallococcus llansteffanensis]RKH46687.1 hypothetical protein D7V93_34550 [Corallococcus llansteffanensis]
MSDTDFGRGAGPTCALHPLRGATGTCARCGNFMCDTCSEGGTSSRCPTCRERHGLTFPLHRDNWSVSALWDVCWAAFQREWGMLSLAVLISLGVSGGSQLLVNVGLGIGAAADSPVLIGVLGGAGFLAQLVVQGLVQLGLLRVCFDVLQGGRADVARLFSQMHKVIPYLLTLLVIFAIVVVPMIIVGMLGFLAVLGTGAMSGLSADASSSEVMNLLGPVLGVVALLSVVMLFPLVYVLLPLYFVQPELTYEEVPPSPLALLRRCWELARGQRLAMLGVGLITAVLMIGGLIACCVGLIPAMGLGQLLIAGMYLALRPRSDEGFGAPPG